jgi:hypothetical protein
MILAMICFSLLFTGHIACRGSPITLFLPIHILFSSNPFLPSSRPKKYITFPSVLHSCKGLISEPMALPFLLPTLIGKKVGKWKGVDKEGKWREGGGGGGGNNRKF